MFENGVLERFFNLTGACPQTMWSFIGKG